MSLQLSNRIRQVADKLQEPTTFSQSANKEMADELTSIADQLQHDTRLEETYKLDKLLGDGLQPDQIETTLKELTENNDRPGEIEPPVIPAQPVVENVKKARKVNVKADLE